MFSKDSSFNLLPVKAQPLFAKYFFIFSLRDVTVTFFIFERKSLPFAIFKTSCFIERTIKNFSFISIKKDIYTINFFGLDLFWYAASNVFKRHRYCLISVLILSVHVDRKLVIVRLFDSPI